MIVIMSLSHLISNVTNICNSQRVINLNDNRKIFRKKIT